MIYFDQAASSFPKPPEVIQAVTKTLGEIGANPGRGGHALARQAANIILNTRKKAATLFGCSDPRKVIFTQNATMALNQALKGIPWKKGDHIISTSIEHNSIRRPLEYLKQQVGVDVTYIQCNDGAESVLKKLKGSIRETTKLVAVTHASNVTGLILPIDEIIAVAKEFNLLTLVDASQTAGHSPISMKQQGINMLAVPGHKGLLGPQGTAMLMVEGEFQLEPLLHGGTGSYSELPGQPDKWPEKYESGTLNTPGIAGLLAALEFYEERCKNENVPRETILTNKLLAHLKNIPGVICYGPSLHMDRMPIVAFNIEHVDSQEVAMILDSHYHIAVRAGLHCSPLTHETIGTMEQGVVRASLGYFNTEDEVDQFVKAIEEIAKSYISF